ncbi:MAG TPA: hypothetical protein VM432_13235 [Bdellovibrionales bacterium]|nr:hypothetical protein [Bdellovibrionales bacterium]
MGLKLNAAFFGLVLASSSIAFAGSDVIVAAPGVSAVELDSFAESMGRFSLSRRLLATRVSDKQRIKLKNALEKAQGAYLSNSLTVARAKFREITEMKLADDWNDSQREAIHYAFLRLAQTSDVATERDEWLLEAARVFPDLKVDGELFPPPLIEKYRAALERVRAGSRSVDLSEIFTGYRFVTVNGRVFDLEKNDSIEIPSGKHRISAFSDSTAPFAEVTDVAQLEELHLNAKQIADGSCSEPHANGNALKKFGIARVDVLYPGGCLKEAVAESSQKALDFKPTVERDPLFSTTSDSPTIKARRDWIWIGVAAVAAGAAYVIWKDSQRSSESSSSNEPVHRTGF